MGRFERDEELDSGVAAAHRRIEPVEAATFSLDQPLSPRSAAHLQRLAGNRAVVQLLSTQQGLDGPVSGPEQARAVLGSGGGSSLPTGVRQRMEGAFGADFSTVRVHTGPDASASATAMGATAYTAGDEIVLGPGAGISGPSGERTLAHELTHVVQQRSGPVDGNPVGSVRVSDPGDRFERQAEHHASIVGSGGSVAAHHGAEPPAHGSAGGGQVPLQRLSVHGTDWSSVTGATHTKSGAVGVVIVRSSSGSPVVVKAGETFLSEGSVTALLHSKAQSSQRDQGWGGGAPEARPVGSTEAAQIHAKVEPFVKATPTDDPHRRDLMLGDLKSNKGVMVFGFVEGSELSDVFKGQRQTKRKGFFNRKQVLRPDSVAYQLFHSAGLLRVLGRAAAADIVAANNDRLVHKTNFQNLMIDMGRKQLTFIDNIEASQAALLHDFSTKSTDSAQAMFQFWAGNRYVKMLAAGDVASVSDVIVDRGDSGFGIEAEIDRLLGPTQTDDQDRPVKDPRKAERAAVLAELAVQRDFMKQQISAGLLAGRARIIQAMRSPQGLVGSVDAAERDTVRTAIRARALFLQGEDAATAWSMAKTMTSPLPSLPTAASAGAG